MNALANLMDLTGRRALITGAAGGLGSIMADSLGEMGADLILVDLKGTCTPNLAIDLAARHGITATSIACNLEDHGDRCKLARTILESGGLSILVNNAAFVGNSCLPGWTQPLEGQSIETWRRAMEVNLTAAFHLCQVFAPVLKASQGGSIINIASIYGQWGPDWSLYEGTPMGNPAAYSASKGGLIQLTRWLSTTLCPYVRVNAISPGGVAREQPDSFVKRYESRTPMRRMATEDDFRGTIAYLASDLSAYVTGQVIAVDGGWSAW